MVRDARLKDPVAKSVLKVIADQSNDAGTGVWSSFAYIAWCIERDRSTVIKKCNFLRDMDLLDSTKRSGTTNLWTINLEKLNEIGVPYREPIEVAEDDQGGRQERLEGSPKTTTVVAEGDLSPKEAPIEPEYIDDVDGVPDERQIEWLAFLEGWKKSFPNKAQPRKTNTALRTKFYARLKDAGFRARWRSALWNSRNKKYLQDEGWFKAKWFVHNNDNYEKLLDGTFDFKEKQVTQVTKPTNNGVPFVDARPEE
jgi:hypothetical protein